MLTLGKACFGQLDRVVPYLKIIIQDIEEEDDPSGAELRNPEQALREFMRIDVFVMVETGIGVCWVDSY